ADSSDLLIGDHHRDAGLRAIGIERLFQRLGRNVECLGRSTAREKHARYRGKKREPDSVQRFHNPPLQFVRIHFREMTIAWPFSVMTSPNTACARRANA